jgi:hypothetical protein
LVTVTEPAAAAIGPSGPIYYTVLATALTGFGLFYDRVAPPDSDTALERAAQRASAVGKADTRVRPDAPSRVPTGASNPPVMKRRPS